MFLSIGGLLFLIGAIWLVVLSFQTQNSTGLKIIWAIANFFFNPIAGIIFYIVNKVGLVPMILCIIGAILSGYGMVASVPAVTP